MVCIMFSDNKPTLATAPSCTGWTTSTPLTYKKIQIFQHDLSLSSPDAIQWSPDQWPPKGAPLLSPLFWNYSTSTIRHLRSLVRGAQMRVGTLPKSQHIRSFKQVLLTNEGAQYNPQTTFNDWLVWEQQDATRFALLSYFPSQSTQGTWGGERVR